MLDQIETKLGELSGVSRQRMGQVQTSELVGNVERSISQSSAITEIWFYQHNEVKRRVLEAMLDVARIAWRKGKKINFITDDLGRQVINVGGEFSNTQFGVFIGNTAKDNKNLAEAKSLLQSAIQGDKIRLSEAVTVLNSDSLVDIRKELEAGEDRTEQSKQQAQESAQKSQEQMAQQAMQAEQASQDLDREKNVRDNDTKIQVAYINKQEGPEEGPEDQTLDYAKQDLDNRKHADDVRFKNDQLNVVRDKNRADEFLRKKEIEVKRIAANKKPSGGSAKK
jgi:hypothetical protein